MDAIVELLQTLNSLSPLAIIALLGLTIFLLVKGKEKVETIEGNHLHDLSGKLDQILEVLQRMEVKLSEETAFIRARINGHGHK